MPRPDYKRCRMCGRFSKDTGLLSHTRLCEDCSRQELESNVRQMIDHRGPNFMRWRQRVAASVGGVLLDDPPPSP